MPDVYSLHVCLWPLYYNHSASLGGEAQNEADWQLSQLVRTSRPKLMFGTVEVKSSKAAMTGNNKGAIRLKLGQSQCLDWKLASLSLLLLRPVEKPQKGNYKPMGRVHSKA